MGVEVLGRRKERKKCFRDSLGFVGFIDSKIIATLNNTDPLLQNREYNGWKSDTFWKCVLVWDTNGRCVDAEVNLPGELHDLKATAWCRVYEHIARLPDSCFVCAESAFEMTKELEGKIVKSEVGE